MRRITKLPVWAWLTAMGLMFIVTSLPVACTDDDESPALQRAEQRADQLARQLESERRGRARDRILAEAGEVQAEEDHRALATVLVSTGLAIVILVLLLARERRARRVLERLLRMILDRLRESRSPPK